MSVKLHFLIIFLVSQRVNFIHWILAFARMTTLKINQSPFSVQEMLALSSDARALLADCLVESLDPVTDDATRALWVTEAIRRRDEVRSGAVKPISAEVVLAEANNILKK